MNARSVVFEMSPDKVDDAVSQFEDGVIPRFREISGYKGFTLLVNRENGKTLGISFWESEDGVNASGDLGAEARQALADTAGASAQSPQVWKSRSTIRSRRDGRGGRQPWSALPVPPEDPPAYTLPGSATARKARAHASLRSCERGAFRFGSLGSPALGATGDGA